VFIDPGTSAETPVAFRFEYNSDEEAFGFRNEQNMFVSFKQGSSIDISDTTATASTVLSGYVFYASDETRTIGSYIPLDTSDATASAENIEVGKTAYVNGIKITGTASILKIITNYRVNAYNTLIGKNSSTDLANYAIYGCIQYNSTYMSQVYVTDINGTAQSVQASSIARSSSAATSIGNYALFGGGRNNNSPYYYGTLDIYDTSLTKHTPANGLSRNRYQLAATNIGNYALFGGGYGPLNSTEYVLDTIDAFDTSLSRSVPTGLSQARETLTAASNSNYALFGGGTARNPNGSSLKTDRVDAFNALLTRSIPTVLSEARYNLAAANVGDYVLFGGGIPADGMSNVVDTYNVSLTKSIATVLSEKRAYLAATSITDYALFGGGSAQYSGPTVTVDAYDSLLSKNVVVNPLSEARNNLSASSIGSHAFFIGGFIQNSSSTNTIDVYTCT
jgi:hypothetical protein